MSLMGMRRFVKDYGTPVWIALAVVLIAGSLVGFGSYFFGGNGRGPLSRPSEVPIATVGEMNVTSSALDRQLDEQMQQQRAFMPSPTPLDRARMRVMLLDQLKQQQALVAAAKKEGVTVTDADVQKMRDTVWQQQRPQLLNALQLDAKATDADMDRALSRQQQGMTVGQIKQQFLPEEQLRLAAYQQKLQDKFKQEAASKATEEATRKSLSDVSVRHILIKFGAGGLPEAQAKAKAQKILDAVKADPSKMAPLARENSDDPGSKASGGLYDWTPSQQQGIVPEFREALATLEPGKVYPELVRVENPGYSGFHIIQLVSRKPGKDFPKDFDKNKQKYIDQYAADLAQQRVQQAVAAATPGVKVEVKDPGLRAAQLQMDAFQAPSKTARDAKLKEALAELEKVKTADDRDRVLPLQKASLYEMLDQPKEAIAAYQDALQYRNSLDTRLALARLYLKQKDKKAATAQLQEAEKLVRGEIQSQFQLASLYREAGQTELAKKADKKAEEMLKRQAAINQSSGPTNLTLPETGAGANGANDKGAPANPAPPAENKAPAPGG